MMQRTQERRAPRPEREEPSAERTGGLQRGSSLAFSAATVPSQSTPDDLLGSQDLAPANQQLKEAMSRRVRRRAGPRPVGRPLDVPPTILEEPESPQNESTETKGPSLDADGRDYSKDRGEELAKPALAVSLAAGAAAATSSETSTAFTGDTSLLPGLSGSQTYGALAGLEVLQGIVAADAIMTRRNGKKMMAESKDTDKARYQLGRDKVSEGNKTLASAAGSMVSGGLKAGAAVAGNSATYVGDFASTAGSLAGAAGAIGAIKGGYDLVQAGKSGKQAYQRHAKAKANQKKALTPAGRGWLKRVQNRQKWKGTASAVKGIAAALGIAGSVAAMFTPVGWAVALVGAGVGLTLALSKLGKKVGEGKSKRSLTKSIGRGFSAVGRGLSAIGSGAKRLFGFGKKKPAQTAPAVAPRTTPAPPPRQAIGGDDPVGPQQRKEAMARRVRGPQTPQAPGDDMGMDNPGGVEERAEAIGSAKLDPKLNLDPTEAAQLEPEDLKAKASEIQAKAEELEVEYTSNQDVAIEVRKALVSDPAEEQGTPAVDTDSQERKLGGDGGLVVSVLDIPVETAVSPSGEELLNKRMSALDGI